MPRTPIPLLVCSIGNPTAAYANTLHSAGHVVLRSIQDFMKFEPWKRHLGGELSVPPDDFVWHFTGYRKAPSTDDTTLWMSGSLMNLSGPAVRKAWDRWRAESDVRMATGRLVIVHDELEKELGKVGVKMDAKLSAKGHNGIKSLQSTLGNTPFIRIGVGIGRPESREPSVISQYVLRKMTSREKAKIEDAAGDVKVLLRDISDGYIKG